jgi:tetratricopeptide (TPR) repeat protein
VSQSNPAPDTKSAPPLELKNPNLQHAQIFISYSRSDRLAVDRLVADLRNQNYSVWMDVSEQGIEPGEDWQAELVKQLSDSEAVLACVSPDFLKSRYCKAEIEQAQRERKPIYPAMVRRLGEDDSLAAMGLAHLQFVDLTQDYAAGFRRLTMVLPRPRFPARALARRAVILAAAILTLVALFVGLRVVVESVMVTPTAIPPTPTPHFAGNETGVLVSYFVLADNTSPKDAEDGQVLIEGFSGALQNELDAIQKASGGSASTVIRVLGPQGVDPVLGADSQTRQANAGVLAQRRTGTAVVVYGVIGRNRATNQFEVLPEFYVAPGKYFADAQDIVGAYAIGKGIRVDPANSIKSQAVFAVRIRALAYIIEGLSQHVLRNYDRALTAYQAALDIPEWTDQDGEGRDVLYTLIGNTHMRLAEKAASACRRADVLQEVQIARDQYAKSQSLNPGYVRAYAGLANTAYFSALWHPEGNDRCKERKVDASFLDQALEYLAQAQQAAPATDVATVKNLLLNEAQIRFARWLQRPKDEALYQAFVSTARKIIDKYDRRDGIAVAFPVMESHILSGLGLQVRAASGAADYRAAIDEYEQALAIYSDSSFKDLFSPARAMTVYGWEGDCYLALADYTNADRFYNLALKIAEALDNQAQVRAYQDRLRTLDARRLGTAAPTATPVTLTF